MSYFEHLTARRDHTQAHAFLAARRFMYHAKTDPLSLDFPLPVQSLEADAAEKLDFRDVVLLGEETSLGGRGISKPDEVEQRYQTVPVLHGFTGADLTVIQYGRMITILERGLNQSQQRRWQALEAELLGPSIELDYLDAIAGRAPYSPDEVTEGALKLGNPYIRRDFENVDVVDSVIFRPASESEDEQPAVRTVRREHMPKSLRSFADLLDEFDEANDGQTPGTVQRIDSYIISKLLPEEGKL